MKTKRTDKKDPQYYCVNVYYIIIVTDRSQLVYIFPWYIILYNELLIRILQLPITDKVGQLVT